jgi:putative SOS response-associated peptidase YedK
MCNRYVLPDQAAAEREFMPAQVWWNFAPCFNQAPQQYVPAIRLHDGKSEAVMLRWGFVPAWAEGRPGKRPPHCVDVDELADSKLYAEPWRNAQRCILPVAGFYSWQLTPSRHRQPFFVNIPSRSVFGLAAVWDRSEGDDGDVIESCSIICVPPNELMTEIANTEQRMPAILKRKDYERWLHGTADEARSVLQPYPADWMLAYAVGPRINSLVADDPGLISPVAVS